jgi:hypothetical protein
MESSRIATNSYRLVYPAGSGRRCVGETACGILSMD